MAVMFSIQKLRREFEPAMQHRGRRCQSHRHDRNTGSNVPVGLAGPMGWITALYLSKTPTARRRGVWAGEERCRTGIQQPCAENKIYLNLILLMDFFDAFLCFSLFDNFFLS